ncbi:MAG: 30S ribosomal protein S3 [Patescibacteria group bacterium]|nr:30S ribosomal protein S3 [Patescibacteria group bacterium]MBU1876964.1 30S ribosomal protein S3 [Patescibacteria group bacterium]
MTHKVNQKVFRIKEINDWDSRGFYEKKFPQYLEEDFMIRDFLDKKLKKVGIEKIEIERFPSKTNIIISTMKPGFIIGRGGKGIEDLRKQLENYLLKNRNKKFQASKKELKLEIREIKNPWTSANLTAQWVAQQIEKRMPYRRILKQTLAKVAPIKEIKGCRVAIAGRLNGTKIARDEWMQEGQMPRQTIRADIDYANVEAFCTYGKIGIKVWIYKGEKF